jgi:hypothetical protein
MTVGTAVPNKAELNAAKNTTFIQNKSITDNYTVGDEKKLSQLLKNYL